MLYPALFLPYFLASYLSFTPDKGGVRKYNTVMNQTLKNVALSLAVILLVAFLCLTGYIIAAGIWAFFLNA
ncbi:MAG: hypothetical protein JXB38_04530 [Anaerolineales bacterium]|nr:hypothetical protein [Anaerolineales bacterium]